MVQEDDYELNVLADNIKISKFHHAIPIDREIFKDIKALLKQINQRIKQLDSDLICTIDCVTITEENINQLINLPVSAISIKYEKMTTLKGWSR